MNRSIFPRAATTAALLAGFVAVAGCDNGLTDINRNPNSPDKASADQLFPNAVEASVSRTFGSGLHMRMAAIWAQHYAQHRYTEEDVYVLSDSRISTQWTGFYAGPQQDFQEVIQKGTEDGKPNVAAMGRIMQSWTFHVMTDLWGDIGYTDALKGREKGSSNTPKLDPQKDVYNGLLASLKADQAALIPGGAGFGNPAADLIYKNDAAKWKKFANSLRLRMAMRLSNVDAAKGKAEFADALAAGVFTSNADNAQLVYSKDEPNVNPIFAYIRGRDDHTISATMVDTLKSLADPRLAIYATKSKARGEYAGMPNGVMYDPPLDSLSRIGDYYNKPDASAVLMSYSEVLFLQAEAAQRGWTGGDAAALYRQAITAAMQQLGIAQAAIDAYLAQPKVAYNGLASIHLQKWIALFGNGPEAWAEWRRTGYPVLKPGPDAQNSKRIPVRLPYPQDESRRNPENIKEATTRQGGAGMNDKLWWNK
jgi:hypothetical protein